jgi:hypothetical protein
MDITAPDNISRGIIVTISVNECDGDYWASTDITLPDTEEINTQQFLVAQVGLQFAIEQIEELLNELDSLLGDEDDD